MTVETSLRECKVGEACYNVKPEDEINDPNVEGFFEVSANEDNALMHYAVKLKNSSAILKSISTSFVTETREEPHLVVEHVAGSTVNNPGPVVSGSFGTHPSNFDIVLWKTRPVAILSGTIAIPIKVPIEGSAKGEIASSVEMHHFVIKKAINMN